MRASLLSICSLIISGCTVSAWISPKQLTPRATQPRGSVDGSQLIDVHGAHAFIAASAKAGDLRGPCPGLNALANHGYIPRNGVVPTLEAILVSFQVFGLGPDIGTLAGLLAAVYASSILDLPFLPFSIGGPPPPDLLGGILGIIIGNPVGLSGTHNQFEHDASATRCDLYQPGCKDNYGVQPYIFKRLLDRLRENSNPVNNLDIIIEHRRSTYQDSVANNPYFFYGPVEMLISCTTHLLIKGLMSNHSSEYPNGYLSAEGLKSLYGVHESADGTLEYRWGTEQIPDNWYRRSLVDSYLAPTHSLLELVEMWTRYPETLLIGGNINGTNTFAPIDIKDLTHGVYSAERLLEGNNAACFAFHFVQLAIPSILVRVEALLAGLLEQVANAIGTQILALACPQLEAMKLSSLERYPGYMKRVKRGGETFL
ncbi:Chloroperoxidase [Mycena crocata]|nr:Chloroperoxidase [Mycena crocata]